MTVVDRIETWERGGFLALVRITADDGSVGWGQTSPYLADASVRFLHGVLAEQVLGRDPWSISAITDHIVRAGYKHGGQALLRALCGVDTALLDLAATRAGVPVHTLLGGPWRTTVPLYASSMRRDLAPEEELERLAALCAEQGFTAVKVRVGDQMGRDRDAAPGRTEALVRAARGRLGDGVRLLADANGAYSASRAIQVGRLLEANGFDHFEEPCPYPELEQTARVTAALDITVAGGEQDDSLPQLHRMIANHVVDVIQPDIGYLGGVSRALQVARTADAWGVPCLPHCANHSLLQMFALHLAAAAPSIVGHQEWSVERPWWEADLFDGLPEVVGGAVTLADRPGWGVEIAPAALAGDYRESRR